MTHEYHPVDFSSVNSANSSHRKSLYPVLFHLHRQLATGREGGGGAVNGVPMECACSVLFYYSRFCGGLIRPVHSNYGPPALATDGC